MLIHEQIIKLDWKERKPKIKNDQNRTYKTSNQNLQFCEHVVSNPESDSFTPLL